MKLAVRLPLHKPTLDQLDALRTGLSALATVVSKHSMTAQLELLSAESAEELAIAIAKFHGALKEASAAWATFADQTSHWAH
jgi:hypothetical protein